jgi:hypothetical protein
VSRLDRTNRPPATGRVDPYGGAWHEDPAVSCGVVIRTAWVAGQPEVGGLGPPAGRFGRPARPGGPVDAG